jgi:predicted negative regulator of RcsB-dependent stress response
MSLDLEEQEQLDSIKAWWAQYGNLISWVLIAVLASFAAYNAWNWYQREQGTKASAIFEELEKAVKAKDLPKVERVFGDLKDQFGKTSYAQMGGLSASKALYEGGKKEAAEASLKWTAENATEDEYKSIARLRLAGLLLERKAFDEALKLVAVPASASFAPLYADRRGDVYFAQGKRDEARAEYKKALDGLEKSVNYRDTIELKLNALGGSAS